MPPGVVPAAVAGAPGIRFDSVNNDPNNLRSETLAMEDRTFGFDDYTQTLQFQLSRFSSIKEIELPTADESKSLNNDPRNLRAEALAMEECKFGLDVAHVWSEQEMVSSFGGRSSSGKPSGRIVPGTPDGMFEEKRKENEKDGRLTCVQVVRVPITASMTPEQQEQVIFDTVLVKVIKSQRWMEATDIFPDEFNIFCWCQDWPRRQLTGDKVQALIDQVCKDGWPMFTLKLMVLAEPGELFPCKFAYEHAGRQGGRHSRRCKFSVDDLSTRSTRHENDDDSEYTCSIFDEYDDESVVLEASEVKKGGTLQLTGSAKLVQG